MGFLEIRDERNRFVKIEYHPNFEGTKISNGNSYLARRIQEQNIADNNYEEFPSGRLYYEIIVEQFPELEKLAQDLPKLDVGNL